jgi:hypothetical protein
VIPVIPEEFSDCRISFGRFDELKMSYCMFANVESTSLFPTGEKSFCLFQEKCLIAGLQGKTPPTVFEAMSTAA